MAICFYAVGGASRSPRCRRTLLVAIASRPSLVIPTSTWVTSPPDTSRIIKPARSRARIASATARVSGSSNRLLLRDPNAFLYSPVLHHEVMHAIAESSFWDAGYENSGSIAAATSATGRVVSHPGCGLFMHASNHAGSVQFRPLAARHQARDAGALCWSRAPACPGGLIRYGHWDRKRRPQSHTA